MAKNYSGYKCSSKRLVIVSELDFDILCFSSIDFEVIHPVETKRSCNQVAWEHFNCIVHITSRGIIVSAGALDAFFKAGKCLLQVEEFLVSLQVRIILSQRKNSFQCTGQFQFSCTAIFTTCIHRPAAELYDFFKCSALILGIPLDRIDEVGDEVIALLEIDID